MKNKTDIIIHTKGIFYGVFIKISLKRMHISVFVLMRRESAVELQSVITESRGHAVAQLVETLRYKPGSIPDGVIGIFH